MEVDHCGGWVTKRNLKLENFLRKLGKDSGFPRYYETCALERKGVLSLRYVIITDTTLLFTENVPKSVILSIPFSDIRSIEMVADRKVLLKGGKTQQCICQHVQLQCITPSVQVSGDDINSQSKGSSTNAASGRQSSTTTTPTFTLLDSSNPADSDSSFTEFSRQSSRLEGSLTSLPQRLLQAYESPVVPILPPLLLGREARKEAEDSTSSSSPSTTHLAVRLSRRPPRASSQQSNTRKSRLIWSESGSASDIDGEIQRNGDNNSPLSPNSWAGAVEEKKGRPPRRPHSLDTSQLSRLRHRMMGMMVKEEVTPEEGTALQEVSPPTNLGVCVDFYLYRPNSVLLNELFLFWNRHRLKILLREDFELEDNNHTGLRVTEKVFSKLPHLLGIHPSRENLIQFHDLLPRLATLHKTLMKYQQLSRVFWKDWTMVRQLLHWLEICSFFSEDKSRKEEMDEDLFLDRLSTIAILMDIFRLLLEATGPSWFLNKGGSNNNNNNNYLHKNNNHISANKGQEQEIRRTWTVTSSSSRHKSSLISSSSSNTTTLHELTSTLTRVIFQSPLSILPPTGTQRRESVKEVVCNPRKFADGRWLCSTDTKVIKAVSLVHNSSVALLHEILSMVHFSSKDKERAKFMSCLQSCPMEPYLAMSMAQLLNLLWDNGVQLGASQTVMLFRHVSTAQTLIASTPSTLQHLRQNFCEEFRYFVHQESANKKIPDRYLLKPTLLSMYSQLHQEIIDK